MNEYVFYLCFFLTNTPLYVLIFQLIYERQRLQNEVFSLMEKLITLNEQVRDFAVVQSRLDNEDSELDENEENNGDNNNEDTEEGTSDKKEDEEIKEKLE